MQLSNVCAMLAWALFGVLNAAAMPQHVFMHHEEAHNVSECPRNAQPFMRVAIIGSGAGGSSAAHLLSQAQARLDQMRVHGLLGCKNSTWPERIFVSVYERSDRIGGRALSVHPLDDPQWPRVDVGASIIADVNEHMIEWSSKLGLELVPHESISNGGYGLWNGDTMLIDNFGDSKWDQLRLYWRYRVKKAIHSFVRVYSLRFRQQRKHKFSTLTKSGYPWRNVDAFAHALDMHDLTEWSARDYFLKHSTTALFVDEIMNGVTRANYAQQVNQVHALAGMVAMGASNAVSVRGGNEQVFQRALQASGASVRTGIQGEVTGLMRMQDTSSSRTTWWVGTRDGHGSVYDAVIIATPWSNAHITLLNTDHTVPDFEMQKVHETLVVTDASQPSHDYFHYGYSFQVPRTILTTEAPGKSSPEFLSLSYIRVMRNVVYKDKHWHKLFVVKLFSHNELSAEQVQRVFGRANIVWTKRFVWDAYPRLMPTPQFAPFLVDENVYYINAFESFISTMETGTIAAKNVVALLLQKWLGAGFVLGQACSFDSSYPNSSLHWDEWGCT